MTGKILLVDDDLDTLQLVGTMLERQGYQILAANNGEKALDIAQRETPDLILLDVMMPGMDGFEVTRKLRSMESTAFIPIILFTAKAQVDDKVEGFESGADDYLTKPTHPAELIARVKTILSRPQTGSLVTDETAPLRKSGQVIGIIAAKGGFGVSTLAINLGVSIQNLTNDYVSVAELCPGRGDIGVYLGYTHSNNLSNLLRFDPSKLTPEDVEEELITHGSGVQLLLASNQPRDDELGSAVEQFETIVKHLSGLARYIILDLGAGLPKSTQKVLPLCDTLIVVLEASPHAIMHTKALLKDLEALDIKRETIRIALVNRIRTEITIPATEISSELGYDLTGIITPAPELAYQAARLQQPMLNLQPESLTTQQVNKLAKSIVAPARKR